MRLEHDIRRCRQLRGVPATDNELDRLRRAKGVWVLERRADKNEGVKYAVSDVQVDLREQQQGDEWAHLVIRN